MGAVEGPHDDRSGVLGGEGPAALDTLTRSGDCMGGLLGDDDVLEASQDLFCFDDRQPHRRR